MSKKFPLGDLEINQKLETLQTKIEELEDEIEKLKKHVHENTYYEGASYTGKPIIKPEYLSE